MTKIILFSLFIFSNVSLAQSSQCSDLFESIKTLSKNTVQERVSTIQANMAMSEAIRQGDLVKIKEIIKQGSFNIHQTNEGGSTILHSLAHGSRYKLKNYLQVVELFIKSGVDVNYRDMIGETALNIATREGDKALVELLIKYGGRTFDAP